MKVLEQLNSVSLNDGGCVLTVEREAKPHRLITFFIFLPQAEPPPFLGVPGLVSVPDVNS